MIRLFLLTLVCATMAAPQDFSLAKRYEQDKVYRSAAEYYKRFLNESPSKDKIVLARWGLARSLTQLKLNDEALLYFDLLLKENSDFESMDSVLFENAQLLESMQRQSSADKYYQVALMGKNGLYRKAHYKAVEKSYSNGDLEATKNRGNTFLKKYEKGDELAQIYLWLGLSFINEKAYELAGENLKKSLELKENAETWLALGEVESNLKKEDPSIAFKKAARDTTHVGIKAEIKLVELWSQEKKYLDLANWYLSSSTRLKGENLFKVIEALIEAGQNQQALTELKQVEVDENLKNEKTVLKGRALLGTGDRLEGIRLLKEIGETGNVSAWRFISMAYQEDEMYLNAIQVMYRVMEYSPAAERSAVMLKIAEVYENKLKRYSTAHGVYQQFERDFPNDEAMPQAIMGIARCLEVENQIEPAGRYYQRVFEDYPMSEFAQLAKERYDYIIRHKTKDVEGAFDQITDLLMTNDENTRSIILAKSQLSKMKNYKSAYDILRQLLDQNPPKEIKYEAMFLVGQAYLEMANKFQFEKKIKEYNTFKEKALLWYADLSNDSLAGPYKEKAAYELLKANSFSLSSYLAFVEQFKDSKVEGEIYYTIGMQYLNEYNELKTPVSKLATEYFQKVLNVNSSENLKLMALNGLAESYLAAGNAEAAMQTLTTLNQWDDKVAKSAKSLLVLGKVQIALNQHQEAIKNLNEIHYRFRNTPEAGEALILSAEVLIGQEKLFDAAKQLRMFINSYPAHEGIVDAYLSLSKIKEKEKAYKSGYDLLGEFVKDYNNSKNSYKIHQQMATLSTLMDDRLKAAKHYEQALKTAPENEKEILSLRAAEVFLALEKYEKALGLFSISESLTQNQKIKAVALSGRLASMMMLGKRSDYDNAFKIFRKDFEEEQEAYARVVYYEARKKMEDGESEKAIKRFEYLADRFEETSWAKEGSYYTGVIAFKKGKYTESISHFEKYLQNSKLGKNVTEAKFKLAGAYFQLEQYDKSGDIYEKISEGEQGSDLLKYRSRYNAAITFEKIEDWYRAALMYSKIFERDVVYLTNNNLKVSAGFAWFNAGEYGKAINFFKEVMNVKGSERIAEAHYWYAKTLDYSNRSEEAIEEFLKVSYLYRGEGMWGITALFEVGQIYERSADYERAQRMYQQIVDQDGTQGTLGARALVYLEKLKARP